MAGHSISVTIEAGNIALHIVTILHELTHMVRLLGHTDAYPESIMSSS